MPAFDTDGPIEVTVDIGVGHVRLVAGEGRNTVVEVRPTEPGRKRDVAAARSTRVEFDGGRLLVRGPRGWHRYSWGAGSESVDVDIALPAGSRLRCEIGAGDVHLTGSLAECHAKTGAGDIRVDEAGPLQLRTGAGDVTIQHAAGRADIRTGAGSLYITAVEGTATIRCSLGDTWIGRATGDLRVRSSHGGITVDGANATVVARTSVGDIRLGDLAGGIADARTAYGSVEIGIHEDVPAWLDLDTTYGTVVNQLDESGRPAADEHAVEVHARTSYGRITVRRAHAAVAAGAGMAPA